MVLLLSSRSAHQPKCTGFYASNTNRIAGYKRPSRWHGFGLLRTLLVLPRYKTAGRKLPVEALGVFARFGRATSSSGGPRLGAPVRLAGWLTLWPAGSRLMPSGLQLLPRQKCLRSIGGGAERNRIASAGRFCRSRCRESNDRNRNPGAHRLRRGGCRESNDRSRIGCQWSLRTAR